MTVRIPMGGLLETTKVIAAVYAEVTAVMQDTDRFTAGIEQPWGRSQAYDGASDFGRSFARNAESIEEGLANLLGVVEAVYMGWGSTDDGMASEFSGMTFEEAMARVSETNRPTDWESGMTDGVAANPGADRGEGSAWVAPATPPADQLKERFPEYDDQIMVGELMMPRYQAAGMSQQEYLEGQWHRHAQEQQDKATGNYDYRGFGEKLWDGVTGFFAGDEQRDAPNGRS